MSRIRDGLAVTRCRARQRPVSSTKPAITRGAPAALPRVVGQVIDRENVTAGPFARDVDALTLRTYRDVPVLDRFEVRVFVAPHHVVDLLDRVVDRGLGQAAGVGSPDYLDGDGCGYRAQVAHGGQ